MDPYGAVFELRDANLPDEINYLRWSVFDTATTYLDPSKKEFMINYRDQNLDGLLQKLKANGAVQLDSIESYDYGRFVHLLDPFGNKIELWEPVDEALTELGGETNK
ncbi:MAG: VOC family protein [Bacteroidales bacterium]|nr:VOC family protein [Bacteroidales bacterium]